MSKIALLQPLIPHYRREFFAKLKERVELLDIYTYNSPLRSLNSGFKVDDEANTPIHISNIKCGAMVCYTPFVLMSSRYDTLVLMLNFAHITTWILLLTKFIHRKRIILWGQGISVKRYLREERKLDWKLKIMVYLSDGIWLYTKKELNLWRSIFTHKKMVALDNTISDLQNIVNYTPSATKQALREMYNIKEQIVLIFCARFDSQFRRVDLLLETIKRLDKTKFGFIIIGDGKNRPNFEPFHNVYEFGALYDQRVKEQLFAAADLYFQPGWVGLSIVEAMAYAKPILTFVRSEETKQCVEYYYIKDRDNGLIFDNIEHCIEHIESITSTDIKRMGDNAKRYVQNNLSMDNMVQKALSII